MSSRRRRALVRALGALGAAAQLLVSLMAIVIFPAAFVSVVAGVAAVRLVARDVEAASMRFGVALLASLVGLVAGFASGAAPLALAGALSTGCFAASWRMVQELERERRAAFGIRHRDWSRRDTEAHRRRDALLDGRRVAAGDGGAVADDEGSDGDEQWWRDLD